MALDPICGTPVDKEETEFIAQVREKKYYFCSEYCKHRFLTQKRIAYLSMEIGLISEVPTYSGGLGVLAGDTIRSSADLKIPLVAVTLLSEKGYFRQDLTKDGDQIERPDEWTPSNYMNQLSTVVSVPIQGREVKVKAWLYDHQSLTGGIVSVLFLDTDLEENTPEDRNITSYLYGGDAAYRLKQEIVLGIGGIKMVEAADFKASKFHMNEGHSSLLTLELLRKNEHTPDTVRDLCIFTTHTPVEAGHDKFSYALVQNMLDDIVPLDLLKEYGGQDHLNMTRLALNLSKYVNGVAKRHRDYSRKLFPGYHIFAITNGIHPFTWTCECLRKVFDKFLPGWANEPSQLVRVTTIPEDMLWDAHMEAKNALLNFVKEQTNVQMDPDVLTIAFARRATAYKRPTLFFSDLERLRRINKKGKIQLIFAGKAHPNDNLGKNEIKKIFSFIQELKNDIKIVYLKDYDLSMATKLTSGADVWLNTPLPPYEASGTSGMKAALNGVLNFSVLDGWWLEGWVEEVTGWSIGPSPEEAESLSVQERKTHELNDLYNKLSYIILPTYYKRRNEWIALMINSIEKLAVYFNSHRMMQQYVTAAYL